AMAKQVQDRYASMTALAEALEAYLSDPGPTGSALATVRVELGTIPIPSALELVPPAPQAPAPVAPPPGAGRPGQEQTNSLGMTLVLIPAGEFIMGSPDSDKGAYDD